MKCPSCGAASLEGAAQCAGCGVDFAKWEKRQLARSESPAPAPAASGGRLDLAVIGVVVALLAGGGYKVWRYLGRDSAERARLAAEREALKPARVAEAPPAAPAFPVELYKRLDAPVAEINGQWQGIVDPRPPETMRQAFAAGWSGLDNDGQRFRFAADPAKAGIIAAAPELVTPQDGANMVKCLKNGQLVYEMGPGEEGYGPCWRRDRIGSERQGDFLVIYYGEGKPGNNWLPQKWHRAFRIWTPYTEDEVLRLYAWHLEDRYGTAAQTAAGQEAYKQQARISEPGARDELSRAVYRIYESRARYEGGMARIEYERARLP